MPTQSSNTAAPCPACGAPAQMMRDEEDESAIFARCTGSKCDPEWQPLDVWNGDRLQVVPMSEAPPMDSMPRADGPDILRAFEVEASALTDSVATLAVTSVEQKAEMALARKTERAVVKLRNLVDKKRKEVGLEALRRKQKIDADFNTLIHVLDRYAERLDWMANFEVRQIADERSRVQQEREDMLRPFILDQAEFLEATADIAKMSETAFYHLRDGYEVAYVARQKREQEAQQAAEAAAQKDREERAAERAETERLRKEAAVAREAALKAEAAARAERIAAAQEHEAQLAAERKRASEAAAKERERQRKELAAAEAEREKVAAAARKEQARLQAIADAAELEAKIIREAKERADAEAAAQAAAEQAARDAAAKAPDKEKLMAVAERISDMQELPTMATSAGAAVALELAQQLAELADWLRSQAEAL